MSVHDYGAACAVDTSVSAAASVLTTTANNFHDRLQAVLVRRRLRLQTHRFYQ